MQRIAPLDDAQVVAWEEKLEAQMVESLQSVMDRIADQIAKIQVASAWLDSARIEVDIPLRALIAAVTTGPDGDDLPPPMTAELAIPDPPITPALIPDTPALPPGAPYISPDDLAQIAPLWQQAVAEQILPLVAQVFIDSAGNVRSQLLESVSPNVTVAMPRLGSIAAEQYLAQARNSFDEVGDHLWETARAQMSQGFDAGESIPQIADRLRQSAGLTARQGVLVARTSVIEASNSGSLQMAQVSGLQMQKEWISTLGDGRTRPSHLAADGQRVDLNEPFVLITGNSGMFPAALSFPPADRYRCRCTIGYILPDRPKVQPSITPPTQAAELAELPGTSGVAAEIEAPPALGEILSKPSGPGFDQPAYGEHAPSYVRPSLQAAKTPRQLRRVWQDEVQAITGFPFHVDAMPRGISLATAREYAEGTLQMFAQFPGARVDRIHWFDDPTGPYGQVRKGAHAIELNMRYAAESARSMLLASRRRDVAGWDAQGKSWSVRNDVPVQGVIYHEFTHIIDVSTLRESVHPRVRALLQDRAATGADVYADIDRQISAYASSNLNELIAEATTDVMVNGARASALSREIFDLLRAEYRARGFEVRTAPVDDLAEEAERLGEVFPKAAAPRALSSQTVAQLRALAKERGITVPPGTRKADLVRMLEEAPPTPPVAAPAAIVEAPPLSRAPLAYQARQAELREAAARPVLEGKSRRMSGESAYVTRVEHEGGPPTITKDYTRQNETLAQGKRSADAEELGALVDDAVGLRAPTVIRTGPRSIEAEFLEGQSGEEILPWPHDITPDLVESDDGRLMGLADLLLGDTDRNAGNFIRLADGRLAPIDRGAAFAAPKLAGAKSPFAEIFAPEGKWAKSIDIAPADLAVIRARLEALRPEFERLGRATWHRQVMARLADVEKRADPAAAIRLAEARPDLAIVKAQTRATARAQAATIATRRGNAALIARIDELVQAKASKAVIRQELDPVLRQAEQLYAGADDAVADALRAAVDSGDAAKIRAVLTRQSKVSGLTPIGKAGAKAKFDPTTMKGVGGTAIPDGADVVVVRRGAKLAGIETPEKAVVRLASTEKVRAEGDRALAAAPIDASMGSRGVNPPPIPGVTEAQQQSLIRYRGHAFGPINDDLRGFSSTEIEKKWAGYATREEIRGSRADVAKLDEILDQSRLTDDVALWRGAGSGRSILGDPATWGDDLTGFTWKDQAYTSATASREVATDFLRGMPGQSRLLLRILAPKGTKAIKISDLGPRGADEAELLLGRGATFRVVRDQGWSSLTSPAGVAIPRVRTLDVEVVVPRKTPPLPKSKPASTEKTVARGDFSGLTRTGEALGGNPGGTFEAGDGSRWYVKAAAGEEQARSEALALDLYRAAGLDAPELVIGQGVEGLGTRQVATRFLDDAQVDLRARLADDPAYIAEVQDGFAVDAWLANWDVVGANPAAGKGWDNIVSVAGRPVRIEAGGALRYRGLGDEKAFGDIVYEFDTLRDPAIAGRAAQVFESMTPEQIAKSAERVRKVTPAKIRALVKKYGDRPGVLGLDPQLADTLIARRADILRRAELLAGPKPLTPREYAAKIKAAAKKQEALDAAPMGRVHVGESERQEVWKGLEDPQIREAVREYQQFGFEDANGALRAEADDPSWRAGRPLVRDMDRAFDDSRLTADVELWRAPGSGQGIFGDVEDWGDDLAGFEWQDPAYSSTSASRAIADHFAKDDGVRLRILAPKGSKAVQLSGMPTRSQLADWADETSEAEILLARGARYRVVRDRGWTEITHPTTHQKIRIRDLDVEVVVPDETPPLPWETK